MLVDCDVVIEPGAALFPFGINIWGHRQRLQGGIVQLFKKLSAAGTQMAGDLVVELDKQRADSCI